MLLVQFFPQNISQTGFGGRRADWQNTQACRFVDRQTDRQTDRQAGRQTDRQSGWQAGRQTGRQTGRQADRQTGRQADRQADRQTGRHTGRQVGKYLSIEATVKLVTSLILPRLDYCSSLLSGLPASPVHSIFVAFITVMLSSSDSSLSVFCPFMLCAN